MQPRLTLVTLGVEDFGHALAFYRDGLGLPVETLMDDVAFFRLGGVRLSIYPREALAEGAQVPAEGSGFRGVTLAHNVASKAEVDAVLEEAVRAGARLVKPAQDVFWGGYSVYFADPDGHLWEVAWNPHLPLD
jgi:uncharacterized protein